MLTFLLALLALLSSLTGLSNVSQAPAPDPSTSTSPEPTECTEDMPCWDCTTMGNHICGPIMSYPTLPEPTD